MNLNILLQHGSRKLAFNTLSSLPVCSSHFSSRTTLVSPLIPLPHRVASCQSRHYNSGNYFIPWPEYPVNLVEQLLYNVHHFTGLPWWGTIVSVAFVMKVLTFPLGLVVNRTAARIDCLGPEVKIRLEALKGPIMQECRAENLSYEMYKKRMQEKAKELTKSIFKREKVNPYWSYILWLQLPVWVTFSIALRDLSNTAGIPVFSGVLDAMAVEGALWFKNLLMPDPYFILPILFILFYSMTIELVVVMSPPPATNFSRFFTKFSRVFAIPMFIIACNLPMSVVLYFVTLTSSSFLQCWLLYLPSVRRLLRIPKSPKEKERPVEFIRQEFEVKLREFLEKQKQ